MSYIYLDESGQFAKKDHGKYFIVGSFTIGDHRRTEKRFRSWCRTKFPKKMRFQDEIKFSQNNITDDIRIKTIKYISKLDIRIRFCYLLRKNIPKEYWEKKRLQSGILYTALIGEVIEMYLPTDEKEIRVYCDQRKLMGITKSKFQEILKTRILPKMTAKSVFTIDMLNSLEEPNIQIADWITGALARYLEQKPLGNELFLILKNNLLGEGKELFKNHWVNEINKKLNRS